MNLSAVYPFVLPEVIGCPYPTLDTAILRSATEFCRHTLCWDEVIAGPALLATISDYDIDVPSGAVIGELRDVWVGTRKLKVQTLDELNRNLPAWRTATSNSPLYYNGSITRDMVSVFPIPDSTAFESLTFRVSYVPSLSASTLPDFLGDRYMDAIAAGAKARLMTIPLQQWTSPQLAAYYKTVFDDGVIEAKTAETHGRMPSTVTVAPRPFGF